MSRLDLGTADGRATVVVDEASAGDVVADGMTIAVGGFINSGHPMTIVRQIIRAGVKDLRVVGAASAGLDVDMLIAAGCVREVVTPYVGAEGLAAIGPAFRARAQEGAIEVFELDEAHFYAGLRAAAQRLPFNPWRAGVGTSYPEINPALKEFTDPIKGERLIAVPAIDIDVTFLHAAQSDAYGNVQHHGTGFGDRALHAAADMTVVQVERLVSNEQIRANPQATSVAGADRICRLPFGAHPFGSQGFYPTDEEHIRQYVAAASELLKSGSSNRLDDYFGTYVHDPKDHAAYLTRVGWPALLELSEF
jgi:glutaconate CoA-transferase, subunit A